MADSLLLLVALPMLAILLDYWSLCFCYQLLLASLFVLVSLLFLVFLDESNVLAFAGVLSFDAWRPCCCWSPTCEPGQYSIVPISVVCVPESCQMPLPGGRISAVYFVKKQVKAFSLQKTLATPEVLSLLGSSVVAAIPAISGKTVGILY